jgi:hypothetical protein
LTAPSCRPAQPLPWLQPGKDDPKKMRTVGWLIDNAMEAIERENPKLKNVLNKNFARTADRVPQAGRPDWPVL